MKDRKIVGEGIVWSTDQRQKKINGLDVHVGFESINQSRFIQHSNKQ